MNFTTTDLARIHAVPKNRAWEMANFLVGMELATIIHKETGRSTVYETPLDIRDASIWERPPSIYKPKSGFFNDPFNLRSKCTRT